MDVDQFVMMYVLVKGIDVGMELFVMDVLQEVGLGGYFFGVVYM